MSVCSKCHGSGSVPIIGAFTIPCGCGIQAVVLPDLLKARTLNEAQRIIKSLGLTYVHWKRLNFVGIMFGPDPNKCHMAVQLSPDLEWLPWNQGKVLRSDADKAEILDWMLEYLTLSPGGRKASVQRYKDKYVP